MKIEKRNQELVITLNIGQGGIPIYSNRVHKKEYALKLMETFSGFLIGALERRMEACKKHLLEHLTDICFISEGGEHLEWHTGQFNVPSFDGMQCAVNMLRRDMYSEVLGNIGMIDQILKSLLNDTEQHPDRIGDFKYSELISMLMEHHVIHDTYKPTGIHFDPEQ